MNAKKITAYFDPFKQSLTVVGPDGSKKGYLGQIAMQKFVEYAEVAEIIMTNGVMAERNRIIRKFYALSKQAGFNETLKQELFQKFGKWRLSELTTAEIKTCCEMLTVVVDQQNGMDVHRKRVLAAICAWLRQTGQGEDIEKSKAIACRATGYDNFNRIPAERLKNIYNCFLKKSRDFKSVEDLTETFFINIQKYN